MTEQLASGDKPWMTWTGRVLTALPSMLFLFSASMKLRRSPEVVDMFVKHLGYPDGTLVPIGVVEVLCTVLYLVPQTAVLGAALLTAYLGGAVATHVRVGEPFAGPILVGVFVWGGLFLRDARIRALLPLRRGASSAPSSPSPPLTPG